MSGLGRYLKNAAVLVGASLLMRSVSLFFNAYVSGKIGAEGMGLFSLVMSVYGFAVTFATSGINLAVTRLCAEVIGEGKEGEVRPILRRAVLSRDSEREKEFGGPRAKRRRVENGGDRDSSEREIERNVDGTARDLSGLRGNGGLGRLGDVVGLRRRGKIGFFDELRRLGGRVGAVDEERGDEENRES